MRDGFAHQLEAHLRRAALPVRRVARAARIPHQTLSNWLRGTRPRWHATLPDDIRRLGHALALHDQELAELLRLAGCLPATAAARPAPDAPMHPTTSRPPGWILGGTHPDHYDAGVEPAAVDGSPAAWLRLRSPHRGRGMATVMQQVRADPYRGQRLRLSALVRTAEVERWSGLWMRIEGAAGPRHQLLAMDNMRGRPIIGTTGWTRHAVVLDVTTEAARIVFGFLLAGAGRIWVAGVRLERASTDDVCTGIVLLRDRPVNLDFAQPAAG